MPGAEIINVLYHFTKKDDKCIIKELYEFIYELNNLTKNKDPLQNLCYLYRSIGEDLSILSLSDSKIKYYHKYFECKHCKVNNKTGNCKYGIHEFMKIYSSNNFYNKTNILNLKIENKSGESIWKYIDEYGCLQFKRAANCFKNL